MVRESTFPFLWCCPYLSGAAEHGQAFSRGPGSATSFSKKGPYLGVSESVRGSPFSPRGKEDRVCRSAKHRPRIASAYILARRHVNAFFFGILFFRRRDLLQCSWHLDFRECGLCLEVLPFHVCYSFWRSGATGPELGSTRLSSRLPQRIAPISIFSRCLATDSVGSQTRTFLGYVRVRIAGSVWGSGASYTTGTAQLWTLAGWLVLFPGENKYIPMYIRTHWQLGRQVGRFRLRCRTLDGQAGRLQLHCRTHWHLGGQASASASLPSRIFAFLYLCFALSSPVPPSGTSNPVYMHRSHSIPPIFQTATCMPLPYTNCCSPL